MSPLAQLRAITTAFTNHETVIVMTANISALNQMKKLIEDECGINLDDKRFHVIGIQVDKVNKKSIESEIRWNALEALKKFP